MLTEDQKTAIANLLRCVVVVRGDPYWHYYCLMCCGRSQSSGVSYRPHLNASDYPPQHVRGCSVPVLEALLLTERAALEQREVLVSQDRAARQADTARRRSEGAKCGWEIRRQKEKRP